MQKPNILFIMADQQRADSFGEGRHPCANYPNLERLKEESANFTQFFTAAMACGPSRNCFLTGLQPWQTGISNARFNMYGSDSWMSALRDNGYLSLSVGKTHMVHSGSFHKQIDLGKSFGRQDGWDHFKPEASPENKEQFFDIATANQTCDILENLKLQEDPFAMFVGFHAPHEPYVMPEEYLEYCRPEDVELPETAKNIEFLRKKSQEYQSRAEFFKKRLGRSITDKDIRRGIAGHHCLLKMVDDCLGRILLKLEETGLLENTLIIYTSDYGDVLGEHRIFNKGATYHDSETRIPMMMRFPDGKHKGKILSQLCSSLDFTPTLFDLLNIEVDRSLPGRSLKPVLEEGVSIREGVTCSSNQGMMYRTEKHKIWMQPDGDGEMYDLVKDPLESNNLFNDPEHFVLKNQLLQDMLKLRMADDFKTHAINRREGLLRNEVAVTNEPEVPKYKKRS
ncbi:MAG: sulfatase-like hydrolase/transferase [Victivallales bacterium]|nr:sulfatase-like hydrolase/transferase [Victivallales bacterium]